MYTFLWSSFLNDKTKSLFTPWKLEWIKKSKNWFCFLYETFDSYLFQLIVILKTNFNSCDRFALSWIDKTKIET